VTAQVSVTIHSDNGCINNKEVRFMFNARGDSYLWMTPSTWQ
jgi:hypothetical protein